MHYSYHRLISPSYARSGDIFGLYSFPQQSPFISAFNVGDYRRAACTDYCSHDFFRSDNVEAEGIRQ